MIAWVFVVASDGVSWVSSWAIVTWVPLALLSSGTASCAKCSCSRPTCATGPVNGPSIAIDALQLLVAAADDVPAAAAELEVAAGALLLLLLELPQPTATSAVSAAATNVKRTFMVC